MIGPTVEDIKTWSKLDFEGLDFDEQQLQVVVDRATEDMLNAAGRTLDTVPPNLVHTVGMAIQLRVEQMVMRAQPDVLETAADFDLIANFSVTGYSETRRGLDEYAKAKFLNAYGPLHDALKAIMTPDKLDEWTFYLTGEWPPAMAIAEIDLSDMGYWEW